MLDHFVIGDVNPRLDIRLGPARIDENTESRSLAHRLMRHVQRGDNQRRAVRISERLIRQHSICMSVFPRPHPAKIAARPGARPIAPGTFGMGITPG
jgi:hypothetical protein